ncbi:protein of unknown function DUF1549 [Isosphaera pallida ATCC 43644]|uniref:DUF1553 domain-containing protein n=2 Tax=Isosphaera pallida TaxID=128 RepID=E8R1K4_ISOPI|nr:protein of unknown function DUF1549 [Isosphaera pallida ATCC 43644]
MFDLLRCPAFGRLGLSSNRAMTSTWKVVFPGALALTLWISAGVSRSWAETPPDNPAEIPVAPLETFRSDQKSHWAYQPVQPVEPPEVEGIEWVRNPIDRFILEALETVELRPSPPIDRAGWLRRVSFDLIGLPPTVEELDAFLNDPRPDHDAQTAVVDRLLASPRYGERWAQHWLDLAHYADSNGFELDAERPDAWRYRDWLIRALNDDVPYDRFLMLQIAGDELAPGDLDALIATGFLRCGPREVVAGNIDPEEKRQSELTEVVGTVGSVMLGLTLGCARCHDHKFDAIPTTDYYRMQAFFAGARFIEKPIADETEQAEFKRINAEIDALIAPLKKEKEAIEQPHRARLQAARRAALRPEEEAILALPADQRTPEQNKLFAGIQTALRVTWEELYEEIARHPDDFARREALKRRIFELDRQRPRPLSKAMVMIEPGPEAPMTRVLKRGNPKAPGAVVDPRPLGIVLANQDENAFTPPVPVRRPDAEEGDAPIATGRKTALAAWIASPHNPLTARVMVNRLWQHHFGRGIVATPGDFGVQGEPPTHPELLDWLAAEFIRQGWSLKTMHRLMILSATYAQDSADRPDDPHHQAARELDPDNHLLWRMNRRRLDAEAIRDATLAVSGSLSLIAGGPGVLAPLEPEIEDLIFTEHEEVDLWPEATDPAQVNRRSIYLFRKRNVRYPLFDAFDAPDTQSVCAVRADSTHALQALTLLNSAFALDQARALAGRLLRERPGVGADADHARIDLAARLLYARPATPREHELIRTFLDRQTAALETRDPATLERPDHLPPGLTAARAAAWVDLARAWLNSNEFLYVR